MQKHLIQGEKKGAWAPFSKTSGQLNGFGLLAVALAELVDLLGGLQDVLLAGIKRV